MAIKKKTAKLKPLKHEELIKFRCGAVVEIRWPIGSVIIFKSNLFKNIDGRICVVKENIPLIIKTLQRALITK